MSDNKLSVIVVSLLCILIVGFIFLQGYVKETRLKKNYAVKRAVITGIRSVNGKFYWCYEFYIHKDDREYSGAFYERDSDFNVGDSVSVAYQKDNIENNYPVYLLFKGSKNADLYKKEFLKSVSR